MIKLSSFPLALIIFIFGAGCGVIDDSSSAKLQQVENEKNELLIDLQKEYLRKMDAVENTYTEYLRLNRDTHHFGLATRSIRFEYSRYRDRLSSCRTGKEMRNLVREFDEELKKVIQDFTVKS